MATLPADDLKITEQFGPHLSSMTGIRLFFGTREQVEQLRPLSTPVNRFQFGNQVISTRVSVMAPRALAARTPLVDVTAAMDEQPRERSVVLRVLPGDPRDAAPTGPGGASVDDPFAGVTV